MPIALPNLPYASDALEPVISRTTLKAHHGRHHRGYVEKMNALIRDTDLADQTLETIVKQSALRAAEDPAMCGLFNNAAQAWNHRFYWKSLRPKDASPPRGVLATRIDADFGSVNRFAEAFKAAATGHFGSGWAWLIWDAGALKVVTTSNADTPITHGEAPLLVIDVWEHAYYLDHQERRGAYVDGVVDNLLNWELRPDNRRAARLGVCRAQFRSGERETSRRIP